MALRHRIVNFKVAKVNKHKVILYYHHKKKKLEVGEVGRRELRSYTFMGMAAQV